MELEHSFTIPVPAERAWQVLLDVEQVAPCMPGATVDSVEGDVITGRIKVKVGPVALTYSGSARFTERDEQARSVTLKASGKETRGSGTASATVHSSLRDEGGQTRVIVRTTMSVTGRPAQFGRGVIAEVGGRVIEKFASNLAAQLAGGGQAEAAPTEGNGALALPVEELHLPTRAFTSLRREGIHTVGDLSARTEAQLRAISNLGPASVRAIKQKLAERGLTLAVAPEAGMAAPGAASQDVTASAPPRAVDTASVGAGKGAAAAGGATPMPPRAARPPDEDAIDLLSVAGFPVLKRALPVAGAIVAVLLLVLGVRRRHRRRRRS
jgi:carbon monoxide dehydrogenase subunit G